MTAPWSEKLAAMGMWSGEDEAKLAALVAAWTRDGHSVLDLMMAEDPVFFVSLAILLFPHAVIEKLEDTWINEGFTDADVRAMLARRKH
jgi:hypothetical protein